MNIQKLKKHIKVLHPITLFANVIAAFIALFIAFLPFIHEKNFGIVIALFFGTSFGLQTWFYYVKGFKESEWANAKYITSQRFTSKLLDQYALFNYKFWGIMKVAIILLLAFTQDFGWFFYFLFFYTLIALFMRNILYSKKILPVPEGFIRPYVFIDEPKLKMAPRMDVSYKQMTGSNKMKYD